MDEINQDEIFRQAFKNFIDMFVIPEVERRQDIGELPKPLSLNYAQIIFSPHGGKPDVRINSEVGAIVKIRLKPNVKKDVNDLVSVDEIDEIEGIMLTDNDDPNSGHVTMLKINNQWIFAFDFIYNKALSLHHIKTAEQFIASAEFSLENKHWSAFIDNLFSASELLAKAVLIGRWSDSKFVENSNHRTIHSRFNKFAQLGNTDLEFTSVLNKLSHLRYPARYANKELILEATDAKEYLDTVKSMLKTTKEFYNKYSTPN